MKTAAGLPGKLLSVRPQLVLLGKLDCLSCYLPLIVGLDYLSYSYEIMFKWLPPRVLSAA